MDAGIDAGTDAGEEQDAGTDAGMEDMDAGTDAGMENPDAGCGGEVPVDFSDERNDVGWPDLSQSTSDVPACATFTPDDCTSFSTIRFTDQATMDAWFQSEFQSASPYQNVNWNLVDVVVSFNCMCNTYGYSVETVGVYGDACSDKTDVVFSLPGETCFTWQTMSRYYSAVQVPKGEEGRKTRISVTTQVVECG